MTREEMRYKLNELRMMLNDGEHGEEQGILVEIISELDKDETRRYMSNLISRQAVINAIANTCFWLSGNDWNELIECIDSIPAVENKEDWIPVSSGELPKIGQRVIATIESLDDGRTVRETTYNKYGFLCGNGVAWMPLPEPYKERGE